MEYDVKQLTWDTISLYPAPDAPELERNFADGSARAKEFRERYLGRVALLDAAGLREALVAYEALEELLVRPQLYAHLLFSADSGNDLHKTLS